MNRNDLITEKELAEIIGLTQQSLSNYRKVRYSKKKMKDGTIKKYEYKPKYIENIDYMWEQGRVLYFKSKVLNEYPADYEKIISASKVIPYLISKKNKVAVPFIEESASAGKALPFMNDDLFVKTLDLNDEYIEQPANNYLFRVSGDSMEPEIEDGCLVVVDTLANCQNGNVVIASIDGSLVIKRYINSDGLVILRSSNSKYNDIIINEFADAKIWGVVLSKHVSL